MRQPSRRETELREALQRCESRQRMAVTALNAMERRIFELQLTIEQASIVHSRIRSVRLILIGEVVT